MNMQEILVEKVTLNIGAGEGGQKLENAKLLLERLSGRKAIKTLSKTRNPVFHIKKGDPIGVKVTLRGKLAEDILKKSLKAAENKISKKSIDKFGNFSFGVKEYIDYPGIKYDPTIGIIGFDVCVTLKRKGTRIEKRRIKQTKIGKKHKIKKEESINFIKEKYNINIE
ncbi:50S ribosomal protein L5 [Candidatus Micrarchaeota archaeon]|nr:50S ribosomal protein L5 [Candidatus Micrarchaeota archaeon]